jgi:hypothetical protein
MVVGKVSAKMVQLVCWGFSSIVGRDGNWTGEGFFIMYWMREQHGEWWLPLDPRRAFQ